MNLSKLRLSICTLWIVRAIKQSEVNILVLTALHLEGTRLPATAGVLLLTLRVRRQNARGLVAVGAEAEVTDRLTVGTGATQQNGVLASRGSTSKLIEGDDFTTSLEDPSTGTLSEAKSGNSHLGDLEKTVVISDSTNDNDGLGLGTLKLLSTSDTAQTNRWAVGLGEEQTLKHNLVETRVRAASQETVQLNQQAQVRIIRLWRSAVAVALVRFAASVDSHEVCSSTSCATRYSESASMKVCPEPCLANAIISSESCKVIANRPTSITENWVYFQ